MKRFKKLNKHADTKVICNMGFTGNSRILPFLNLGVGGQDISQQSLTAYISNR
jgi:hypothetical protein